MRTPPRSRGPFVLRRGIRGPVSSKTLREKILQRGPVEIAEAERRQRPARHREILPRDGGADRQERLDERRLHACEACYRCEQRQAETQILQHVAMLDKDE